MIPDLPDDKHAEILMLYMVVWLVPVIALGMQSVYCQLKNKHNGRVQG